MPPVPVPDAAVAAALHRSGRLAEAAAAYRSVLRHDPAEAQALHGLGVLALGGGRAAEAVRLIGRALASDTHASKPRNNLASALRALGRAGEAARAARSAAALEPGFPQAYANAGNALRAAGRHGDAVLAFGRALRLAPDLGEAHNNLGTALQALGRPGEAAAAFRRALAVQPAAAEALVNAGTASQNAALLLEAATWYGRALVIAPRAAVAHTNLGAALRRLDRRDEAVAAFRNALALDPAVVDSRLGLAGTLRALGRSGEAVAVLREGLARRPDEPATTAALADLALDVCDFALTEAMAARVAAALPGWLAGSPSWPVLAQLAYLWPYLGFAMAERRPLTERLAATLQAEVAALPRPAVRGSACAGTGPLRVGYVSADFGNRPMGHVTRRLFAAHDRARVHVTGYALRDRSVDRTTHWRDIRAGCDAFVDLSGLDDAQAAARIAQDGIDVLVDLTGFMTDARPRLFALRPAPVQGYWLGHHGGRLGMPFHDYILADAVVLPPEQDEGGPESVVRLAGCYHPADTPVISQAPLERAAFGLPDSAVVFASFNNPQKIDRAAFACWMRVLARVPGSVLWLGVPDGGAERLANLRRAAAACGVDPGRLVFAGHVADKAVHFARHRLADLFLDAFRATASTTALDALWAGLPVLTVAGRGVAERIAASMVSAAGLAELVCADATAFEERAVELAGDAEARAALRRRLEARAGTLFAVERLAGQLEAAFAVMVDRHRNGLPPADVEVPV